MSPIFRCIFLAAAVVLLRPCKFAAQSQVKTTTTTITEPGSAPLSDIFQHADIVAVVKTISGDAETYEGAVYKSKVIKSFKGAQEGEDIYFGPFIGYRLGWEYVLFLRKGTAPLSPKDTRHVGYGTIPYAEIFMEGYTAMESSYECVFSDRGENACDHAIRVCTDYIRLPKGIRVYPANHRPFGCGWVRKPDFLSAIGAIAMQP